MKIPFFIERDMNKILDNIPKHVAIIMDGNGRWAQQKHLPRTQGHLQGVKRVDEIIQESALLGIQVLTLYTFSTENWSRPQSEVSMLMETIVKVLSEKLKKLCEKNIRFRVSGRRQGVPESILKVFDQVTKATAQNTGMVLNIAFNYGGRQEIADMVYRIAEKVEKQEMTLQEISDKTISQELYTAGLPDPDFLIRTSGEMRISNFLLWQMSYTELYFTEKFWPEFGRTEFHTALQEYANRQRRFGSLQIKETL